MPKRNIRVEDYPMVLDWGGYETTYSKLPCKCEKCGNTLFKSINKLDQHKTCFCKKCSYKIRGLKKRRIINHSDYPMVLDWGGYETTHSKLPCRCEGCGDTVFKTIHDLDMEKTCFCRKCGNTIKLKQNNLEKYGVEHTALLKTVKEKRIKTNLNRYGVENTFQSSEIKKKIKDIVFEKYGVPYSCMLEVCRKAAKTISKYNSYWFELIKKKLGVESKFEYSINKTSFDLKINNILIDINPTFSHNSTYSYAYAAGKTNENKPFPSTHHFNRWKLAKDNGYTLISIFDNMDENKILNIIRSKINKNEIRIGARECKIKEISQKECNLFLDEYHIQNRASGQKHCIALFFENELVGVMTFGQPRFNKKYDWELVRLCFKPNITVQGGVSKMWNYFKTTYNPTSCICYLNLNLGGDNIHLEDFKFVKYNKPAGYWIHLKTVRTITNNSLRFKGASRFIGDEDLVKYPKGMDNREIMKLEGFVEMYDCGNAIYEYLESHQISQILIK